MYAGISLYSKLLFFRSIWKIEMDMCHRIAIFKYKRQLKKFNKMIINVFRSWSWNIGFKRRRYWRQRQCSATRVASLSVIFFFLFFVVSSCDLVWARPFIMVAGVHWMWLKQLQQRLDFEQTKALGYSGQMQWCPLLDSQASLRPCIFMEWWP